MKVLTVSIWYEIQASLYFFDANKTLHGLKTGAGTTISRLGMPDLGVATLNDMRDNAAMIAGLDPSVPLIADADTGYGGTI